MINKLDSDIGVCHFVGLSGVGGVQRNFVEYIKFDITQNTKCRHKVYTNGLVDSQYELPISIYNIKNIKNLFSLIFNIVSSNEIVHFYNNLSSPRVAFLLLLLPTSNLIFHERGSSWNLPSRYGFILRFISWKSELILANSRATKTLLVKKFYITESKIKVLHNGVNTQVLINKQHLKNRKNNVFFNIGYIGRLDSPKGVHVLIEAMQYLKDKKINLIIAGDGPLKDHLMKKSKNLSNIKFLGRVNDPYAFFDKISLLIVPSIREPFGNVCIEAGICRVPILASNIDGIPEIINNNYNGELISPKDPITFSKIGKSLPLPEYVVDPANQELIKAMQINPEELADKILLLSTLPQTLAKYADRMYDNILKNFSIAIYSKKIHKIYLDLARVK